MSNQITEGKELAPMIKRLDEVVEQLQNHRQLPTSKFMDLVTERNSILVSMEAVRQRHRFAGTKCHVNLQTGRMEELSKYIK